MAFDAYMKVDGVDGESIRTGHEGEIELYSFSLGGSQSVSTTGTGLSGGRVSLSDFSIMKKTDKSSPPFFNKMCQGKHFDSIVVTLQKASGDASNPIQFLKYTFSHAFVSSIQWSGSSGGDDTPSESVSFTFESFQIDYNAQGFTGDPAGNTSAMWNIATVAAAM